MGSTLILTQFSNLALTGASTPTEWELMPGITLSTRKDRLHKLMTQDVKSALGKINCSTLLNGDHFVFGMISDTTACEMFHSIYTQPQMTPMILEASLTWLRTFLRASWLIKDNCMSTEGAFAIYPQEGPIQVASSNSLYELNVSCNGHKSQECILTVGEIKELIKLHHKVETALWECRDAHGDGVKGKNSRIVRCFEFLHCARTSYSIPLRVAHYCSAFEALFASTTTELTHRLSERIAHFVGKTSEDRHRIYGVAQRAYNLRSQVVHGSSLSKETIKKTSTICTETDELLRVTLRRIIEDNKLWLLLSSSNEEIDLFFLNRLMGG